MAPGPAAACQPCSSDGRCLVSCMACALLPQMQQCRGRFLRNNWLTYVQMTPGVLYRDSTLTWMTIALRAEATSTSLAEVMYRSLRSPFSSWLVASRSKIACAHHDQVQGLHFSRQESLIGVCDSRYLGNLLLKLVRLGSLLLGDLFTSREHPARQGRVTVCEGLICSLKMTACSLLVLYWVCERYQAVSIDPVCLALQDHSREQHL